ncbi:uncharacterized protein LOC135400750 isoform X1 [Ornithodoros turicata]|uniref:uncharacterized protein LOC135400750 isoform X1 n=1 Tax=Ornithodoros turicata TaxID=34597 RepID=UPI003139C345
MLGHYTEVRAYAYRDDEALPHADVFLDLDDDPVSKEALKHDWSGMLFSQEQNPFVDDDNDFILIAECNELHGPMPLVTIPHNIADKMENVDINALAINILSVDYQQVGACATFPKLDSQMLMPGIRDDMHILVNYTVMLDPKARGFVRPMCIAYVSSDKSKLIKNAPYIRTALIEASLALKLYNIKYFIQGVKNLLKDIRHTRKCHSVTGSSNNVANGSGSLDGSFQDSLARYEDTLETTLQEVEDALMDNIPFDAEQNRKIKRQAKELVHHLKSLPRLTPELDEFLKSSGGEPRPYEPKELHLPFQRDYEENLVPLKKIWREGFVLCIYWLYVTYKFFRKRSENIAMNLHQDKPITSLRYGACPRTLESKKNSSSWDLSSGIIFTSTQQPCIYMQLASPGFLPFEENTKGPWNVDEDFMRCFIPLGSNPSDKGKNALNQLSNGHILPLQDAYDRASDSVEGHSKARSAAPWKFWHIKPSTTKDSASQKFPKQRTQKGELAMNGHHSMESTLVCDDVDKCEGFTGSLWEGTYWKRDGSELEPSDCSYHGLPLYKTWDAIDRFVQDGSESLFLSTLKCHVHVEDILYSLLTGRPIVIVGMPQQGKEVEAAVRLLAFFAPRKLGENLWFESCRIDPLDSSSLSNVAVVGFIEVKARDGGLSSSIKKKASILHLGKGEYNGPAYSGSLLKQANQRIRMLDEGEALLAVLGSILSDVEYVAHTWAALIGCARKADIKAFQKQKQLSSCDLTLLKHYEKLMGDLRIKK